MAGLLRSKHIYSWKTIIHAAKDPDAIKVCIRRNEHVAITLYRDFAPAAINTQPSASSSLPYFQDRLPLRVVNH